MNNPDLHGKERDLVLDALRKGERFLLATHEHVDGDALGSLVAMHRSLLQLGKDSLMFMSEDEFPLPYEYSFFELSDGLVRSLPADIENRTVIFLDCGNIDRNSVDGLNHDRVQVLNIDHHHDNTRFGSLNYVVPQASCTAEIVWDLMKELGVQFDHTTAEALYIGLVTDTGRFMYRNTGVTAHKMAAELIELGVDVNLIFRRLYEGVPFGKLELLARAIAKVNRYDDGRLTLTVVGRSDFQQTGAEDSYYEGIVDHLRAIKGTVVACLVRELSENGMLKKVSLRATDNEVDVSEIARSLGGGGHRQAAGFSTQLSVEELTELLRDRIAVQLEPSKL